MYGIIFAKVSGAYGGEIGRIFANPFTRILSTASETEDGKGTGSCDR